MHPAGGLWTHPHVRFPPVSVTPCCHTRLVSSVTAPHLDVAAGEQPGGDRHGLYYRALLARDPRFDGWFFTGVTSTGIYCRPSCPSVAPRDDRVRFFPSAAAAQRSGFRACKRCRPDASPGSPEWNRRSDAVGRAMRSIADGVVDREGVAGLARRLGYSARQLHRLLVAEVGAGPLELARAQRAVTARILLETTELRAAEVAFAAGFGSVRQFNDTVRHVFAESPSEMRTRARRRIAMDGTAQPAGGVTLRLAYRSPLPLGPLFSFLAARAVPGVEEGGPAYYRRSLRLAHGAGIATLTPRDDGALCCVLHLEDLRDLTLAVGRLRRLFDLDADPAAVAEVLTGDPLLRTAVASCPGLRIPGHVDGNELAVRAVLGQQVSVAGARTLAGRLAMTYGEALSSPAGSVRRLFPSPDVLAELPPSAFPMPAARARAVGVLAGRLASGDIRLDPGADREEASAALLALPGIGPWTVAYVRMRALGDPDAFMPGDLGVRHALEGVGLLGDQRSAAALAEGWRPYRAYALNYLWSGLVEGPESEQAR